MNETVPGSAIKEEVSKILQQLDIEGTPEQKQAVIEQVRIELTNIIPAGNWQSVSSKEQMVKEVDRALEQMRIEREQEATTLAASIRNKQRKIKGQ